MIAHASFLNLETMVNNCSIVSCNSKLGKSPGNKFFEFPLKNKARKKLWETVLNQGDGAEYAVNILSAVGLDGYNLLYNLFSLVLDYIEVPVTSQVDMKLFFDRCSSPYHSNPDYVPSIFSVQL